MFSRSLSQAQEAGMFYVQLFERFIIGTVICGMISAFFIGVPSAQAISRDDFQASTISLSYSKQLKPGEVGQVYVTFQNIGKNYWLNSGPYYVSVYHYNTSAKIESDSVLATDAWVTKELPQKLPIARINPGEQVHFQFPIKAPKAIGTYHSDFVLVAESLVRMSGGKFSIDFNVTNGVAVSSPHVTPVAQVAAATTPVADNAIQPRPNSAWSAALVTKGGSSWQIDPGGQAFAEIKFKNTGTNTWLRDSTRFVSIYGSDTSLKERDSVFASSQWLSKQQPVKLQETSVPPGSIGTFNIELRAPSVPGTYNEQFTLAAEDTAWMSGGSFILPIVVPGGTSQVVQNTIPDSSVMHPADGYSALLLLKSTKQVSLQGNGSVGLMYGFKNIGDKSWKTLSLKLASVQAASSDIQPIDFHDSSWKDSLVPVEVAVQTKPGELGFLSFKLKAPAKKGTYTADFQLYADGIQVEGGDLEIPVTVTADGVVYEGAVPPTSNNNTPSNVSATNLPDAPIVRVGLFKTTDDRMMIRAKYVPVNVKLNGQTVCTLKLGQETTVSYSRSNSLYTVSGGSCSSQSAGVYVFEANDGISPMEMSDYSRPVSWLPGANDNTFRAKLELRYVPDTDNVWTINELPIEMYLRGLAETSDVSPLEYQKALLTAARTYANYHIQHNSKHGGIFHIDAKYDQVYRGYGAEARSPKIVRAVNETRGQIVTYDGKLAITPYFSRSDGRTRSWGEVWYGGSRYPWLVSVPVPWDAAKNRTLWGHGVGMSATGALDAANDGWDYERIVKYFYTGIELKRIYK